MKLLDRIRRALDWNPAPEGGVTVAPEALAYLLVSHDAALGGAQRCLLELGRVLVDERERHVELATCGDGELLPELLQIAPVARLHDGDLRAATRALVSQFKRRHPDGLILVNTAAVTEVYSALCELGVRDAVAWVHEAPDSIDAYFGGASAIERIARVSQRIVVPCEHSRVAFQSRYGALAAKVVTMRNGIARSIVRAAAEIDRERARQALRERIGASRDALIVLGCGMPEGRKGVDLFGQVGAEICRRTDLPVHLVWVGKEIEPDVRASARQAMSSAGHGDRLHFVGPSDTPAAYYAGADLVLITSRVDPSPLVNAEAMTFGLPVLLFESSGGAGEQHPPEVDLGIPDLDTHAMADRALELLGDAERRLQLGQRLAEHVRRSASWGQFADQLDRACMRRAASEVVATADLVTQWHPPRAPSKPAILMVLPDLEIGGGQLNAIRLANALTASHQVFMLNARPHQHDSAVAELISPEVIPLEGGFARLPWYDRAERWKADPNNLDERPHRLRVVVELMKRFQITTVMSQVWWSDRFVLGLRRLAGFRWFVKLCGCYEALFLTPEMDPSFVDRAPRIMRLATGVTYGSDTNLELFEGRLPRPQALRQVFNGFSRALIDPRTDQSPPRSPSDFVFCICSRAVATKGWQEAILAVERINRLPAADRGGKRAKVWLVGDGPVLAPLRSRYAGQDDIVFLGLHSRPHAIMAAADAGLLPSSFVSESVPTMIIEFLACHRPVIATAVGAIPRMLVDGGLEAGLLVPRGADGEGVPVEALCRAMLRYMSEAELYRTHRHAAARVFDAHFDLRTTVTRYLSFFAEA